MTAEELIDYQAAAFATAIYPDKGAGFSIYPYLKLCGEAGEVAEMFGKAIRDGIEDIEKWRVSLLKELGDVLWYCAAIATEENTDLTKEKTHIGFKGHNALRLCEAAICHDVSVVVDVVELIAVENSSTLAEVAALNLAKLAARKEAGTLRGSGSDR